MKLFNVLITPEGKDSSLKDKFMEADFEFIKDDIKFNNKFISNSLLNQRIRIDKFIDTDTVKPIVNVDKNEYTVYSYKTYNVLDDNKLLTDVVLNDKTLNPLILKTKRQHDYDVMYMTFDPSIKLLSYEVNSYDKIIATYHKKDFYGCCVYFDKNKHSADESSILNVKAMDETKDNSIISIDISLDSDSDITVSYCTINDDKLRNNKPNRFKMKLNSHKIPTSFVIVNNDDDNGETVNKLNSVVLSKNTEFIELGSNKITDPEFIKYLKEIISQKHYKSLTLVDLFIPNSLIRELGMINVFVYDTSKKTIKCIRSS